MAIRIGSNLSSIQAQRRLAESSSLLSKTYERLSSGQRINRASDDAAGLAVAESLKATSRIYTQGVRNLNDGLSALQIADSAVENLSQIVTRIRELAEQSANETFSSSQRGAIDKEAKELQKEYFRISKEASFNGRHLFDGSLTGGLRLQGGFGLEGSIQNSLGGVMGDGTFGQSISSSTGTAPRSAALGDLNGDGVLDMVAADTWDDTLSLFIGRGDGTFSARTSLSVGDGPISLALGDVSGDGVLDIVTADSYDDTVSVLLGNGDGTFSAGTAFTVGLRPISVTLGDLDGDGRLDIVTADSYSTAVRVLLGQGDGAFSPGISYAAGLLPLSVTLGDVSGDGILDLITADYGDNYGNLSTASVFIGKGDGTFFPRVSYSTGPNPFSVRLGDLNGDGVLDMVTGDGDVYGGNGAVSVFIGKGDGTFSARISFSTGSVRAVALGDLDGDGVLDIVTAERYDNTAGVLIGKGDGTFFARTSYDTGSNPGSVALGDLNGDGVLDIVTANYGDESAGVLLGDTREGIAPLLPFSLTTQADALQAMAPLDRKLGQLAAQRGLIGAFQSRLGVAIHTLQSESENYSAAESRIRDADIASETAELVRLQISQEAATAVLAQANQAPALAVQLLTG